jgi:hypothetical protein
MPNRPATSTPPWTGAVWKQRSAHSVASPNRKKVHGRDDEGNALHESQKRKPTGYGPWAWWNVKFYWKADARRRFAAKLTRGCTHLRRG